MKKYTPLVLLALLPLSPAYGQAGSGQAGDQPTLLFSSDFNASDNGYASEGSLPARFIPEGRNQQAGADGSGVSGLPHDRSWDASLNTTQGAGSPVNQSRLSIQTEGLRLSDLQGFTLILWFMANQKTDDAVRLFCQSISLDGAISNTQRGMVLRTKDGGLEMVFGNGHKTARAASHPDAYNKVNEWMFVAITWDGSVVRFFTGDTDTPAHEAGSQNFTGPLTNVPGSPVLGNHYFHNRGLAGNIDNFSFYDGPLSLTALEEIRQLDAGGAQLR